ncbi:unnamed protein product [Ilex paraguariensis]|uniref:30S ribosomal protein S9 n=1 Tax=Ilex paraguariensis TaxID=185542 RepID=A0ABC8UVJ5_9AQUA
MLSRLICKTSNLRLLSLVLSGKPLSNPKSHSFYSQDHLGFNFFVKTPKYFSTNHNNNGSSNKDQTASHLWKLSTDNDDNTDSLFGEGSEGTLEGIDEGNANASPPVKAEDESWSGESGVGGGDDDGIFKSIDGKGEIGGSKIGGGGDDGWVTAEGYKAWNFVVEEKEEDVFDIGTEGGSEEMQGLGGSSERVESEKSEEVKQLEREEKALTAVLKGLNRAFGDLIAASGITESMLDSLIALKDLEDIQGLPPLREIEDARYEKNTRKSTRAEIERRKQEEVARARVRQVDEKGRAYGTGRRKCSIARVWIQPGEGQFTVNDKQFDVYFPMLDHPAALLRPFSETKTLGLWDVNCTVKGCVSC